jgi:hypothetical protein
MASEWDWESLERSIAMSADTASRPVPDQRTSLSPPPPYPVPARFGEGEWALMAVPAVICVVMLVVAMVL